MERFKAVAWATVIAAAIGSDAAAQGISRCVRRDCTQWRVTRVPQTLPCQWRWTSTTALAEPTTTPVPTAPVPMHPGGAGLATPDPHPTGPLTPGARPLLIQVTLAPPEMVARTTVTWGMIDGSGAFMQGGQDVLGHQGGVVFAEIAPDADPSLVEVHARVDYVTPEVIDLDYVIRPTVSASGVHVQIPTTSNMVRQTLILRSLGTLQSDDYLVAEFMTPTNAGAQTSAQRGSSIVAYPELLRARTSIVQRVAAFPIGLDQSRHAMWKVYGRLQGRQVQISFDVQDRSAFEVYRDANGKLAVYLGPP